jgi:hypothetical protein
VEPEAKMEVRGEIAMAGYQEVGAGRMPEFVERGYAQRYFFPHRTYRLLKGGPDGFRLAQWMLGCGDPGRLREIQLYAIGPVLDEFPAELFFDDDLIWHQQQFGLPGHIASATLVLDGERLFAITFVSDVVQRVSRRREYKTRIEKKFHGWHYMLWNSVLAYAAELGVSQVYSATAELALQHTDHKRVPLPALYQSIYDRPAEHFGATREERWWRLDTSRLRERLVVPDRTEVPAGPGHTICLCHDIEYGHGHTAVDPEFAAVAQEAGAGYVEQMLAIEKEMSVQATYHVVGQLVSELRAGIEADGHCLAFHSYDHGSGLDQLARCRRVDYRLKGYRVPQSRLTEELTDANLSFHNFEWLSNSACAFGFCEPRMENSVVKIPVLFDDFPLYKGQMSYSEWEARALERVAHSEFVAFGLHDCYAGFWLHGYRAFLGKLKSLGTLKTLNQVAAEVTLSHAA